MNSLAPVADTTMLLDPISPSPQPQEQARGSNLLGVRAYNERLVLSLVRRFNDLPKAEIARLTALSAQTVSVIVKSLEADGLLLRMPPTRGRVGQPSIPLNLNPEGAFSFGLKIGRRSMSLLLMDFVGAIRAEMGWSYTYPQVQEVLERAAEGIRQLTHGLAPSLRNRIVGLGVATPFELWNWASDVGAPQTVLDAWRKCNLQVELETLCSLPVSVSNDATAACGAELTFGKGSEYHDFIYFFVGYFAGGGVVLNGSLFSGRCGNAGALGSLPVLGTERKSTFPVRRQLIQVASLYLLEQQLLAAGLNAQRYFKTQEWDFPQSILNDWLESASEGLAHAIVSSMSVIDFSAAVIDGGFPASVRSALVARIQEKLAVFDLQGLSSFEVVEGSVGPYARTIGAASLPFFARFLLDRDVLFKGEI